MSVILRGFPTEITEEIELPPIAELLTYPIFFDMPIEQAYRYGTDFQKKLISMVPLRGGKRFTSILSEVKFLDPYTRSCTGFSKESMEDSRKEWHIDSEEYAEKGWMGGYEQETDIIHLLSSECTAMTEFNLNEIEVDFPAGRFLPDYIQHLRDNWDRYGIQGKDAPANRIITFSNHLHRAKAPKTYEFRYMFRVVETDRLRPPSMNPYNKNYITRVMTANNVHVPNVQQLDDRIVIYLPQSVKDSLDYRPGPDIGSDGQMESRELTREEAENYEKPEDRGACNQPSKTPQVEPQIKKMPVHAFYWESAGVNYDSPLINFTPQNSIMIVSFGDYSDPVANLDLDNFFKFLDKRVKLIDSKGNEIKGFLFKDFFDIDAVLGPITGSYIQFSPSEAQALVEGEEYTVVFHESAPYSYVCPPEIKYVHKT